MMMSFLTKWGVISGLLVGVIMACGTDTPLADYIPASVQESALKKVLLDFQDSANSRDSVKLAGLIHENATLMVDRERKLLPKADYVRILPKRLADNPPLALGKPKMELSGNTADVSIYMSRGDARFLMTFQFRYDDRRWTISGWTY